MRMLDFSRCAPFHPSQSPFASKLVGRKRTATTVPIMALLVMLSALYAPSAWAQVCPFDDGNSSLEVEGLILTRYALGITGAPLVASTNINAVDAPTVEASINCPSCGLNITGNPTMTVADATIISRKLAGFSGGSLTNGLALGDGTRNTPALVQSFLLAGCGATGGTVTSVGTGTGLTGGPITGAGTIAVDPAVVQLRVSSTCSAGTFITAVAANGTVTCAAAPAGNSGTVTSVATGAGLTGGPISTTGTVSIAAGGVTSAMMASNLSLVGTTTGTFSGPLTGSATGSAASFSGPLAGDVTGTQGATVIAASTVTGKALTGFVSSAGTVSASDTVLTAVHKLNGNVALKAPLASPQFSGAVGIGTAGTGSALTVAGTIESTSGGVRFPDGKTQSSAAATPSNIIIVAKSGGHFSTISAALTSVIDNSAAIRYLVYVAPGTYIETVTMKLYVDIEGAGELATKISQVGNASGTPTLSGASNAELRFLTVENTGGFDFAIAIRNVSASPRLTHITVSALNGLETDGIKSISSSPRLESVTASANSVGGGNYGLYNFDSSPTVNNSVIAASGGTNFGIYNATSGGSFTVRVTNSQIVGSNFTIYTIPSYTTVVVASQLSGGIAGGGGGTISCVGVYDENFVAPGYTTCP